MEIFSQILGCYSGFVRIIRLIYLLSSKNLLHCIRNHLINANSSIPFVGALNSAAHRAETTALNTALWRSIWSFIEDILSNLEKILFCLKSNFLSLVSLVFYLFYSLSSIGLLSGGLYATSFAFFIAFIPSSQEIK